MRGVKARIRLPGLHSGKESACWCRRHKRCGFNPWVRKIPWSRKWQPTPLFLPGEFYGQRSLASYSPWGCKELGKAKHIARARIVKHDIDRLVKKLKWRIRKEEMSVQDKMHLTKNAEGAMSLKTEQVGRGTELSSNLKILWPNFIMRGHFIIEKIRFFYRHYLLF